MRVIAILIFVGWLAALCAGQTAAQTASNAAAGTCRANIEDTKLDAREAVCLRDLGKLASRKGDVLSLQLENGTSKVYRTDIKACEIDDAQHCIQYWLVGYHPVAHVYSIAIRYYEGSGVELVSARTGKTLRLSGVPFFSDDGSRFVVIDNDYAHGGEYDLAVGSTLGDVLVLQWQRESQDGLVEWRHQRWIDNDHVALRVFPADTELKCPDNDCDAILVRFNDGWAVRRVPAPQK
ncbi:MULTISPECIES: hypothetical protein [unclassified Bradyrhizobium]